MKKGKDKSTKAGFIAAAITTVLVGATVFSLYSLAESNEVEHLTLAGTVAEAPTSGRLISRLADAEETAVSIESLTGIESGKVENVDTKSADSTVAVNGKMVANDAGSDVKFALTNKAADSVIVANNKEEVVETIEEVAEYQASEGLNLIMIDQFETDSNEETKAEQEETPEATEEVEVSSNLALNDDWYSPVSFEQSADDYAASYQEVEYTGEWVYDYDSDRWLYVEDGLSAPMAGPVESFENYVPVTDAGDWTYNYNSDEWEYTGGTNQVQPEVSESVDNGNWVYNYDTEEWEYVESGFNSGYQEPVYETPVTSEPEYSGEWIYNYDTEEWEYVESSSNSGYQEPTYEAPVASEPEYNGEWVYNYDTEEWEYVESTGNTDSGYDSDDDDYSYEEDEPVYVPEPSPLGQQIVDYAMGFVGVTPYVWAGRSLYSGTDCSGFVNLIFSEFGIYCSPASLAYDGSRFGYIISAAEARPGDIAVYGGGDHVAIYAGNGYVVHCSSPENGTVYWQMNYRSDFSWFLRVID